MTTLIIIQLILAIFLVILVLLQGSDSEGLGLGGGGALGGMKTTRGSANLFFFICLFQGVSRGIRVRIL